MQPACTSKSDTDFIFHARDTEDARSDIKYIALPDAAQAYYRVYQGDVAALPAALDQLAALRSAGGVFPDVVWHVDDGASEPAGPGHVLLWAIFLHAPRALPSLRIAGFTALFREPRMLSHGQLYPQLYEPEPELGRRPIDWRSRHLADFPDLSVFAPAWPDDDRGGDAAPHAGGSSHDMIVLDDSDAEDETAATQLAAAYAPRLTPQLAFQALLAAVKEAATAEAIAQLPPAYSAVRLEDSVLVFGANESLAFSLRVSPAASGFYVFSAVRLTPFRRFTDHQPHLTRTKALHMPVVLAPLARRAVLIGVVEDTLDESSETPGEASDAPRGAQAGAGGTESSKRRLALVRLAPERAPAETGPNGGASSANGVPPAPAVPPTASSESDLFFWPLDLVLLDNTPATSAYIPTSDTNKRHSMTMAIFAGASASAASLETHSVSLANSVGRITRRLAANLQDMLANTGKNDPTGPSSFMEFDLSVSAQPSSSSSPAPRKDDDPFQAPPPPQYPTPAATQGLNLSLPDASAGKHEALPNETFTFDWDNAFPSVMETDDAGAKGQPDFDDGMLMMTGLTEDDFSFFDDEPGVVVPHEALRSRSASRAIDGDGDVLVKELSPGGPTPPFLEQLQQMTDVPAPDAPDFSSLSPSHAFDAPGRPEDASQLQPAIFNSPSQSVFQGTPSQNAFQGTPSQNAFQAGATNAFQNAPHNAFQNGTAAVFAFDEKNSNGHFGFEFSIPATEQFTTPNGLQHAIGTPLVSTLGQTPLLMRTPFASLIEGKSTASSTDLSLGPGGSPFDAVPFVQAHTLGRASAWLYRPHDIGPTPDASRPHCVSHFGLLSPEDSSGDETPVLRFFPRRNMLAIGDPRVTLAARLKRKRRAKLRLRKPRLRALWNDHKVRLIDESDSVVSYSENDFSEAQNDSGRSGDEDGAEPEHVPFYDAAAAPTNGHSAVDSPVLLHPDLTELAGDVDDDISAAMGRSRRVLSLLTQRFSHSCPLTYLSSQLKPRPVPVVSKQTSNNGQNDAAAVSPGTPLVASTPQALAKKKPAKPKDSVWDGVLATVSEQVASNPEYRKWCRDVFLTGSSAPYLSKWSLVPVHALTLVDDMLIQAHRAAYTSSKISVTKHQRPKIIVRLQQSLLSVSPESVQVWKPMAFEPISGPKNITSLVVFEDDGNDIAVSVKSFIKSVAEAYESCHLGNFTLATNPSIESGLVALPVGTLSTRMKGKEHLKKLYQQIQALSAINRHMAVYVIAPKAALSITPFSPFLSVIQQIQQCRSKTGSLAPFPMPLSSLSKANYRQLAFALYDLLLIPISKIHFPVSETFPLGGSLQDCVSPYNAPSYGGPPIRLFQSAAHVLAEPQVPDPRVFQLSWPPSTLNVNARHRMLHVAWKIVPIPSTDPASATVEEWLTLTCIDERGETWRIVPLKIKHADGLVSERHRIRTLWSVLHVIAETSETEWRIVLCHVGPLGSHQLKEWNTSMKEALADYKKAIHVTLAFIDLDPDVSVLKDSSAAPKMDKADAPDLADDAAMTADEKTPHIAVSGASLQSNGTNSARLGISSNANTATSSSRHAFLQSLSRTISYDLNEPIMLGGSASDGLLIPFSTFIAFVPRNTAFSRTLATEHLFSTSPLPTTSVIGLHFIATHATASSSITPSIPLKYLTIDKHMQDIKRSFVELSTLGASRWGTSGRLPWHIEMICELSNLLERIEVE